MKHSIYQIGWACLLFLATAGATAFGQEASEYRTLKLQGMAEQLAAKGIRISEEGLYPAG